MISPSILLNLIGAAVIAALIFLCYYQGKESGRNEVRLAYEQARVQEQKRQAADEAERKVEIEKQVKELKNYEDGDLAPVLRVTLERMRTRHLPD